MDIGIVSMRYAKALIEYAKGTGAEDRVYHELRMLERSFRKHPDLREALDNPILKIKEKIALICTAAAGNGEVSREFSRFITLVLRNRREYYLQYICLTYLDRSIKPHLPSIHTAASPVLVKDHAGLYIHGITSFPVLST